MTYMKLGAAMRSGLKLACWSTLAALGAWASLPSEAADSAPTAAGAQKFLANLAKKTQPQVQFIDAQGRVNYVTGKYSGDVTSSKFSNLAKTKTETWQLPEQTVGKELYTVRAQSLDPIDAEGRPNECATRITEVTAPDYDDSKSSERQEDATFTWKLIKTNEQWKYEPLTKFTSPPQVIDWHNAKLIRNSESQITVMSASQAFPKIYLTFAAGDIDLTDRLEYAMKFLVMSCDENASTGF